MAGQVTTKNPSETWEDFLAHYRQFKEWPSWSGRYVITDRHGRFDRNEEARRDKRRRHARRVEKAVAWLKEQGGLPSSPRRLSQRHVDWLVRLARRKRSGKRPLGPIRLRYLWQAIVLDRWNYTCWYCGRKAEQVYQEEGRTLRFEMDHWKVARADGGADYSLSNIRPACRTCNVGRGRMPHGLFRKELRSLARAVMNGKRLKGSLPQA